MLECLLGKKRVPFLPPIYRHTYKSWVFSLAFLSPWKLSLTFFSSLIFCVIGRSSSPSTFLFSIPPNPNLSDLYPSLFYWVRHHQQPISDHIKHAVFLREKAFFLCLISVIPFSCQKPEFWMVGSRQNADIRHPVLNFPCCPFVFIIFMVIWYWIYVDLACFGAILYVFLL